MKWRWEGAAGAWEQERLRAQQRHVFNASAHYACPSLTPPCSPAGGAPAAHRGAQARRRGCGRRFCCRPGAQGAPGAPRGTLVLRRAGGLRRWAEEGSGWLSNLSRLHSSLDSALSVSAPTCIHLPPNAGLGSRHRLQHRPKRGRPSRAAALPHRRRLPRRRWPERRARARVCACARRGRRPQPQHQRQLQHRWQGAQAPGDIDNLWQQRRRRRGPCPGGEGDGPNAGCSSLGRSSAGGGGGNRHQIMGSPSARVLFGPLQRNSSRQMRFKVGVQCGWA